MMQITNMARDKKGTIPTVEASKQASNDKDGSLIVDLVVVDGKLTADLSPGVRQ
jgi:hypothetical protein